jgi:hypothetical protein
MSSDISSQASSQPAPCIVDTGMLVNRIDMHRLLSDLSQVRYTYSQDGKLLSEGDGCVLEVFSDPVRSTLIANRGLYLNIQSFDYMQIGLNENREPWYELVFEGRRIRLVPQSNPMLESHKRSLDVAAIDAMVADVLAASFDEPFEDDFE